MKTLSWCTKTHTPIEVDKYRREGSHLYMYQSNAGTYVHVYQNHRCSNLDSLVSAYEKEEQMNDYEIEHYAL